MEDSLCTLQEVFENVDQSVGFNIEVKFDDVLDTSDEELRRVIFPILEVSTTLKFFIIIPTLRLVVSYHVPLPLSDHHCSKSTGNLF